MGTLSFIHSGAYTELGIIAGELIKTRNKSWPQASSIVYTVNLSAPLTQYNSEWVIICGRHVAGRSRTRWRKCVSIFVVRCVRCCIAKEGMNGRRLASER
jgi:hypothetical protein